MLHIECSRRPPGRRRACRAASSPTTAATRSRRRPAACPTPSCRPTESVDAIAIGLARPAPPARPRSPSRRPARCGARARTAPPRRRRRRPPRPAGRFAGVLASASMKKRSSVPRCAVHRRVQRARAAARGEPRMRAQHFARLAAVPRQPPRQHLVGDHAEREQIGRRRRGAPRHLLRRHVLRRAEAAARLRQRLELQLALHRDQLGEPEVEHLDLPPARAARRASRSPA